MFHYLCDHLLFPKSYVQLSFECSLKLFISFSFLAQQPTPKEKSEGFLHATFTHVFSQIQQHNSFTYETHCVYSGLTFLPYRGQTITIEQGCLMPIHICCFWTSAFGIWKMFHRSKIYSIFKSWVKTQEMV